MRPFRDKIQPTYLMRRAIIYRRSACEMDTITWENQRLILIESASPLGWERELITFEQDVCKPGIPSVERPGYKAVLRQVRSGEAGAVFVTELARLARLNGDARGLIEACAMTNTLIITGQDVLNMRSRIMKLLFGTSAFAAGTRRSNSQGYHPRFD